MNEQYQFTAGQDEKTIENKRYLSLNTPHGKLIAIGLDNSGIPFSMKFTEQELFLTYDGNYYDSVMEITKKTETDEYSELVREINDAPDESGYLVLLPTVAYYLHISEGDLNEKPRYFLIAICRLLFQLWFCDMATIQRELSKAFVVNRNPTKPTFSRKSLKASADRIRHQNHAFHDNQERKPRHERK